MKHALLSLTGWALALQFAGLYWSSKNSPQVSLQPTAAQRSKGSEEVDLGQIRNLLKRHQPRQALVESSRALARCCARGTEGPEELHQLLAQSVEELAPPPPPPARPGPRPVSQPGRPRAPEAHRCERPACPVALDLPGTDYPQARRRPNPGPPPVPPGLAPLPEQPPGGPPGPADWQFPEEGTGQHPWPPPPPEAGSYGPPPGGRFHPPPPPPSW